MFEYAVSVGEGTLLEHGICDSGDLEDFAFHTGDDETVIFASCDEDCGTGK